MWKWLKKIIGIEEPEIKLLDVTFDASTIKFNLPAFDAAILTKDIVPCMNITYPSSANLEFFASHKSNILDFSQSKCFVETRRETIRSDMKLLSTDNTYVSGDDFIMIVPSSELNTHENLQRGLTL